MKAVIGRGDAVLQARGALLAVGVNTHTSQIIVSLLRVQVYSPVTWRVEIVRVSKKYGLLCCRLCTSMLGTRTAQ